MCEQSETVLMVGYNTLDTKSNVLAECVWSLTALIGLFAYTYVNLILKYKSVHNV